MDRFIYCRSATGNYAARVETFTCGARQWFWWMDQAEDANMMDPAHPCAFLSKQYRDITARAREAVERQDRRVMESRNEPDL